MAVASLLNTLEKNLPALPQVAWEAMSLIEDPDSRAEDLQKIISRDQALAARVLRLANSAYYGVSRTITTLSGAIVMLGFDTVRFLVLAAASESLQPPHTA